MDMNLRILKYFLAVAETGSITAAAKVLHVSQPALSKQLHDFEDELGTQLFVRGSRRISLTEDGIILRRRAQEILMIVDKTKEEISEKGSEVTGTVSIGAGETEGFRVLAKAAAATRNDYPNVQFRLSSGDTIDVLEDLGRGLLDFGLIFDTADPAEYNIVQLPYKDVWGVILRADDPLAKHRSLTPEDLDGLPLLISRQAYNRRTFEDWFGTGYRNLKIAGTFNLGYDAMLMAAESVGYVLGIRSVLSVRNKEIVFRPLSPKREAVMYLVWKKNKILSRPVRKFMEELKKELSSKE